MHRGKNIAAHACIYSQRSQPSLTTNAYHPGHPDPFNLSIDVRSPGVLVCVRFDPPLPLSRFSHLQSYILQLSTTHLASFEASKNPAKSYNALPDTMTSSKADSSRKSRSSNEPQTVQDNEDHAASGDDDEAQSVDSNVTTMGPPEGLLQQAEEFRQRKITFGGKPTRSIEEYSKEREQRRPIIWHYVPTDAQWFRSYALHERDYFYYELNAWESFMRYIMFTWQRENDLAGGTISPPPPVLEMDPLELHTQYLGFLLQRRVTCVENRDSRWHFESYERFLEHITAVRKQVEEMREEQGLESDPQSMQEQLKTVEEHLANYRSREQQFPPISFFRSGNPEPAENPELIEAQPKSPKNKRARDGDTAETGSSLASKSARRDESEDGSVPVPKRRKQGTHSDQLGSKSDSKPFPKQTRGKTHKQNHEETNTDASHDDEAEREMEEPRTAPKMAQRRRGRPRKSAQPSPAPDVRTRRGRLLRADRTAPALKSAAQGKVTKFDQKQRGRPRGKAQLPTAPTAGKTAKRRSAAGTEVAGVKKRITTTTSSATGLRRSARIAARAQ